MSTSSLEGTATRMADPGYIVATPTPPSIVCPDWCVMSQTEHVAQLRDQEGFVVHCSAVRSGSYHIATTYPDGTPDLDPLNEQVVFLGAKGIDGLSLDEAEQLARDLLSMVKGARA